MKKIVHSLFFLLLMVPGMAQVTLQSGLVAYYPFNGNANDATTNLNNGTVNGAVLTSDRFGNANSAYYFNGLSSADPNIKFPATYGLTNSAFTYSVWVKEDINNVTANQYPEFGNFYNNTLPNGENSWISWYFQFNGSAYISSQQGLINTGRIQTNGANDNLNSTIIPPPNTWTHLLFTNDPISGSLSIYINGILNSSAPFNLTSPKLFNNLIIGREYDGGGNSYVSTYFTGAIDDIRIYNRVLQQCEINQLAGIANPLTLATPTFSPTPPAIGYVGSTTNYNINPVSTATSYLWGVDNSGIVNSSSTSFTKNWTSADVGTRTVSVAATDNDCLNSNTLTSNIVIYPPLSSFNLGVVPKVSNDTLFLQVGINSTSSPFYLGNTSLTLQLTSLGLNINNATFLAGPSGYVFGQNPGFYPLNLITAPGSVTINISSYTASGFGGLVSSSTSSIAVVAIPFNNCPSGGTINLVANSINDIYGNNIKPYANISTPSAIPAALIHATITGLPSSPNSCPVTLTANPGAGFSYLWNTGATSQSITVNNTSLVTATVTQIVGGCKAIVTASPTILPPSKICIGIGNQVSKSNKRDTIYLCPSSSNITLQAVNCSGTTSSSFAYKWYKVKISNGAITLLNNAAPSISIGSVVDPTVYYILSATNNGCPSQVSIDSVYLVRYPQNVPKVEGYNSSGDSSNLTISACQGSQVKIVASNTVGVNTYFWQLNSPSSSSITGVTGPVLYVTAPDTASPFNVFSSFIDQNGCLQQGQINVFGKNSPSYTFIPPVPSSICSDKPILLQISLAPSGTRNGFENGDSLSWNFGDYGSGVNNIKGNKTNGIYHSFSSGGTFSVTGTLIKLSQGFGVSCNAIQTLVLNANQSPTALISPDSSKLCPGNSGATLLVTGTLGGGSYNYVWKGQPAINNLTSPSISFTPTSIGIYTIYASITSDAFGCSSKNVDSVKVLNSPNPVVNILAPIGKDTVCGNSSLTLTATGTGNLTHVWSSGPTDPALSAVGKFASIMPGLTTVYTDTVTDKITTCKAIYSKSIYVSDISLSPITTSNFKPYCFSTSVGANLQTTILGNVNAAPYTYIWSATPSASAGLQANNTVTSLFSTGTVSSLPTGIQNYQYSVQVHDKFNCPLVTSATYTLVVNPVPSFSTGTPNVLGICYLNIKKPSSNAFISGGTTPYSGVYWNTTGLSGILSPSVDALPDVKAVSLGTTVYSAYAVDANGCQSNVDYLTVVGNPLPDVTLSPNTTFLKGCVGSPQNLSINTSNTSGTIIWKEKNSGTILANGGLTSPQINSTGLFGVTVTLAGCSDSSFVQSSFLRPPGGSLSITPSVTSPCSYTVLKVWASNYLGDSLNYQWAQTGGGGTLLYTTKDTVTYLATPSDNTVNFSYSISNRCAGPVSSAQNPVNYLPTPVAILNTNAPETFLNKPMIFTNNSLHTDKPATLILGNGSVTSAFAVNTPLSYQYSEQGNYLVKMKIMNLNGCSDSTTIEIGVIGTKTIFIPNVFNPNANDETNKTFRVFGTNIVNEGFQLTVFNRWGQIVYNTTDFNEANSVGWNGAGAVASPQPNGEGVFTYSVKYKFVGDDSSTIRQREGTVTMLR